MTTPLDRLAVELEMPSPGLVNLLANPTGEGGSVAGWVTPVAGSTMTAPANSLRYTAANTDDADYFYTTPVVVTPGHYVAARWKVIAFTAGVNYYTQRVEFLAADKATVVATTYQTAARQAVSATEFSPSGPQLIPAGASYARLRFDLWGSPTGDYATDNGISITLRDVQMATAPTAAELGSRRLNLVTNGDAENPTPAPTAEYRPTRAGDATANVTSSSVVPRYGTRAWRASFPNGPGELRQQFTTDVAGGQPVGFYASLRPDGTTARQFKFELEYWSASTGTTTLTSPTFTETAGQYVDAFHVFALPAASILSIRSVRIVLLGTGSFADHLLDGWRVVVGDASAGPLFDRDTPNAGGVVYEVAYRNPTNLSPVASNAYGAVEHKFTATIATSPTYWQDLTGPHGEIKIARRPLDAGTLTTVIKPDQIIPSGLDDDLRPGAGYRVTLDDAPLIVAAISDRAPRESSRQVIPPQEVAAADAGRGLAASSKTGGVATLAALAWIVEDLGIGWKINGSAAQVATPSLTATNNNAKAIDQIAMTRDRNLPAYAWINRTGQIIINDTAHLDPTVRAVINEDDYSYFEQGYDSSVCVNLVTVKVTTTTTSETTVTTYGPFKDQASIDEWGEHPVTLTLQGVSSSTAQTVAQALINANKNPPYQVVAVTVPIARDDQDPIALLDLYDLVRVQHTDTGTDQQLRVTAIDHEITPAKWLIKLRFTAPGLAAIPQVIPDP